MARVLYIEDDRVNALIVSKFLENQHEVTVAETSNSALKLLNSNNYDLILMDICLGDEIEGPELMRCIRKIPGYTRKKVIAFTANALLDDEIHYLKAGFDGYMSKPMNRDMLRLKVDDYLSSSQFVPVNS